MIGLTGKRGRRRKQLRVGLKKTEDTGRWRRRHSIALCAELSLEETMVLSQYSLRNDVVLCVAIHAFLCICRRTQL